MTIFEFSSYKEFIVQRLASMPKKGRGEMLKMSSHLAMHSTRISHIFKGEMNLTLEQAASLCKYLGLAALESEYFLLLVQLARAGSEELRTMLQSQAEKIRERSKDLANRIPRSKILTDEEKAVFYSSWYYSGIHLASSLPQYDNIDSIAERFEMPRDKARAVVDFLIATGLCIEADGGIKMSSKAVHLEKSSPLVVSNHANWRIKALARLENLKEEEMAYSLQASVTKADQLVLREMLLQFVEKFMKKAAASEPPDTLACLNIDWFNM